MKKTLRWMKLDNAAKIYPAARRRYWTNVFRLSVTYHDEIDPALLREALHNIIPRFPSVAVRLRSGVFWYYLEEIPDPPEVYPEEIYPLNRMPFRDIRKCAFRVLYYRRRMSVELFHSVTDGNGGILFVKSLAAEYVRLRYREEIPYSEGIFDPKEEPSEEEIEDSFSRHTSPVSANRKEANAYLLSGTPEDDRFMHLTTGILDANKVHALAKTYGVTITVFLAAIMMQSIYEIQNEKVKNPKKRKAVRVLIPVNLRKFFPSRTMRNFALYITPDIDPRLGDFTFEEILAAIRHRLGLELNGKTLASKFTPNVRSEQSKLLRVMPLFIKNFAMKLVYNAVGEKKASICMSNLGLVDLPEEMRRHIERIDFVLGAQAASPCNCGIVGYDGKLYISFIRNIKEAELERRFFTHLRKMGLSIYIESNEHHDPN